jgi:hypothetical protein
MAELDVTDGDGEDRERGTGLLIVYTDGDDRRCVKGSRDAVMLPCEVLVDPRCTSMEALDRPNVDESDACDPWWLVKREFANIRNRSASFIVCDDIS